MKTKGKKHTWILTIISVGSLSLILGRAFLRAQTADEGGNGSALIALNIISESFTEDISKRNGWKREYVVERVVEYEDPETGEVKQTTMRSNIAEISSGLNYLDGDEWKPANPHFVQTATGFELVECGYKVRFGRTLTDVMTYEIDGISIPMRIEYIVISDGTNQRTFQPAANITGSIDPADPSVLHFTNGFNDIDVTYHAERGGFHQNVKIKNINVLRFIGLSQNLAKAYVYTEIDNSAFGANGIGIKIGDAEINTTHASFTRSEAMKTAQINFSTTDGEKQQSLFSFDASIVIGPDGKQVDTASRQLWKDASSGSLYLMESVSLSSLQDGTVIDYVANKSGSITGS